MATSLNPPEPTDKPRAANEELIMGVWTKEEFMDDIVLALFGALVGFFTTLMYLCVSRWLREQKWFGGETK